MEVGNMALLFPAGDKMQSKQWLSFSKAVKS